jgi:hypothetical protein
MKTFGCNFSADVFARFFELVIMLDVINLNDGQYYETHYTCCTFNTRKKNTQKGLTRRSHLVEKPILQKIGALTGFM